MPRPRRMLVVIALAVAACSDTPTQSPSYDDAPSFSFANGPSPLPQLIRIGPRVLFGWQDPATNLGIVIGAPEDPFSSTRCGGTEPAEVMPTQFVGEILGLAKQLSLSGAAHVLVYEGLTETLVEQLCEKTPVASGTVVYLRTDNDFFGALGRGNAFSEHAEGIVALASGGEASLDARLWGLGSPDGVLLWIRSSIALHPHGG